MTFPAILNTPTALISVLQAKNEKLWTAVARREVVEAVLGDWLELCQENQEEEQRSAATLEVLLTALSSQDFKDIKMRIESLVKLPS